MKGVSYGQSWEVFRVCVFRTFDTEVRWSRCQDVLWCWDGGRVKERCVLEDAAGGRVDDGRLEGGGEAAGRADLNCFRARSSHRDKPGALLVVLHIEGVRGADCGNLGLF